jgi:hypothetical protein
VDVQLGLAVPAVVRDLEEEVVLEALAELAAPERRPAPGEEIGHADVEEEELVGEGRRPEAQKVSSRICLRGDGPDALRHLPVGAQVIRLPLDRPITGQRDPGALGRARQRAGGDR